MDVQQIITAVNTALDGIAGLRALDFPPDQVPVPCAVTELATGGQLVTYDTSTSTHDLRLQVRLLVSRASDRAGAKAIHAYLAPSGTSSVKAAIENNAGIAALVHFAVVSGASGFGTYQVGDQQLLGVTFDVAVGCY